MLVLEATDLLQGQRDDDYHWCQEGELVHLNIADCCDPACGCARGFSGFATHRATTTARVVDRPDMTIEQLARLLATSLHQGGWIDQPDPANELVSCLATEIVETAVAYARFGVGTVIERDGDYLQRRIDWDAAA